ncbi:DUF6233 domain-containing protein [Streptomyces sp. SID14515]|uniref:DUF6233 domain-containing protein n=1 Tax=Streptomyces sp. SID14515 TaxID=2706074 RepID=UPI0013CAC637|nr:DUF6233 domain-containing protein [Streptomyces sp. SID14515]NEB42227.1 hypothetical protein [Streptomyces sp. SID14515]
MYDLPPDLDRLRTLHTWHTMWLHRINQAIKAAEQEQAAQQRLKQRRAEATPDWIVNLGIGQGAPPVDVHIGGCPTASRRRRTITREQAINQGVNPCAHCRPDTALGILG